MVADEVSLANAQLETQDARQSADPQSQKHTSQLFQEPATQLLTLRRRFKYKRPVQSSKLLRASAYLFYACPVYSKKRRYS